MRTTTAHVRQHLVAQLEALGDLTDKDGNPLDPEAVRLQISTAKAASALAQAYTATLKVDLEGRKLAEVRTLPSDLQDAKLIPHAGSTSA